MSGLSPAERVALGMVESTDAWKSVDHGTLAAQAAGILKTFSGVAVPSLARLLLTASVGLETALSQSDDPEYQALAAKAFCVELQLIAAAITRKERGLPPIGVNGSPASQEEESDDSTGDHGTDGS